MTIKERAQVLYDFSTCPHGKECEECAASGVMCDVPNMREARDAFSKKQQIFLCNCLTTNNHT